MSTLYDLQGKYASLLELAEDGTTDPEVLADTMDSIVDAINDKAEGYAQVIRQIKADIEANKKERDRFEARIKSYQSNLSTISQRLVEVMTETNQRKIKTPLFTISVAKNGGKQPIYIDQDNLQADVFKVKREPDTDKIRKRLEAGEKVPGAELKPRGEHLLIK
ncbi:MAG: siphovirus Gp157 family protein [Lacticaseibacillus paracasei]|uniref:siphovirus Gp157 family protein n=1 Tax=Lacticaseibacillus paracasei TaxID=1597 RepID=UPI00345D4E49